MSKIDPRLGEFEAEAQFAEMLGVSPKTLKRYRDRPNGLPYLKFGKEVFIPVPEGRAWIASLIKRPNPRRRGS